MKAENRRLAEITPYKRNPRSNAETVAALVESIRKYGFNVPLVLDRKGVIICGHARFAAAVLSELKTVPCITVELSKAKAKRYRLADNKIQDMSKWDTKSLVTELRELPSFDDIPGFRDSEVAMYTRAFSNGPTLPPIDTGGDDGTRTDDIPRGPGVPARRQVPGSGPPEIVQRQVDAAQLKADDKFAAKARTYQGGLISVTCVHCNELFMILRADLVRM